MPSLVGSEMCIRDSRSDNNNNSTPHDQGPRERVYRDLNSHLEQVRDVSLDCQDYPLESASRTGSTNKSTPHTSHRCTGTGIARIYPGPGPALSRFRTALFTFAPYFCNISSFARCLCSVSSLTSLTDPNGRNRAAGRRSSLLINSHVSNTTQTSSLSQFTSRTTINLSLIHI